MYCWKDTNSFSTFSNTITDTSYVLLERHEQRQQYITSVSYCVGEVADAFRVFPTVHNECVIVLEKFLMMFMSFHQYKTSVS
jgi:hypothetical protein